MIETKKILKYTLTPQLMPRLSVLFYSGFTYVSFFMAQTYRAVQLLPDGHPYLHPSNRGRFGVRHVIAEAGNNLVFKKENSDQIAIYFMTIIGMVLLLCQFAMLVMAGFVEIAHAAPPDIFAGLLYGSSSPLDFFTYFKTPEATHDIAFVLLDRIFGIPGISGAANSSFFMDAGGGYSCVAQGIPCFMGLPASASTRTFIPDREIYTSVALVSGGLVPAGTLIDIGFPWPFHEALRGMLQVYSVGLLVIGVFIFCYFFFVIAAETAQTGTAFGRRFNSLWAPIRIVLAFGLLVPITYGLNPGQWILMYAVKWGSSFATNGWVIYNNAFAAEGTLLGNKNTVIATPHSPPVNTFLKFASVLATCKFAYERIYHDRATRPQVHIDAWLVNSANVAASLRFLDTDYPTALEHFNYGTIHIRFGELRTADDGGQAWDGNVAPWCGEITLDQTFVSPQHGATTVEPGSWHMLSRYFNMVHMLWDDIYSNTNTLGTIFPAATTTFYDIGEAMADRHISLLNDETSNTPTPAKLISLRKSYEQYITDQIALAVIAQQGSNEWAERLTELGWGGAAIWYNKIAQLNGGLVSAVYSMPTIKRYPYVMEQIRKKRAGSDNAVSGQKSHQVYQSEDNPIRMDDHAMASIATALQKAEAFWNDNSSDSVVSSSVFIDAINTIFGTQGLFSITTNEDQNIHPLAQLASIGRSIIDSAIRNMGYSAAAGLGGGLANLFQEHQIGNFGGTAASFFFQVAMIGMSLGFVLFYIIPLLPFIYFFFAVGGWIKGIFEAMVGVPLWALAHIRIDGNGMAGEAAMGGYYLILELFLRPILTIFGFIASMVIFTAQVQILNEVWQLVVSNVAGFDTVVASTTPAAATGSVEYARGAVDRLFFTVIYAIICYMLAMTSFKLIDQIPNHILRWLGQDVSSFGDQNTDPAQNLVRNSFIGTRMVSGPIQQAAGGLTGAGRAGSAAAGELFGKKGG